MKKLLIPILAAGSIAATVTPLVTSCGSGWISWDYTKGNYKNDKIKPLAYKDTLNPIDEGFKFLAQDKNNMVYDLLLTVNENIGQQGVTLNKGILKIKINSYNSNTHFVSFQIKYVMDMITKVGFEETTTSKADIDVVCKNIKLNIDYHDINNEWYLTTIADQKSIYTPEDIKAILEQNTSGDWSITGSMYQYMKVESGNGSGYTREWNDPNCNYNKNTLDKVYADDEKWTCLIRTYNLLSHPIYYLKNFNKQ